VSQASLTERADTVLAAEEITSLGGVILPMGAVVFPRVGAAVLTEKKRLLDVPGAVDENHLALKPHDGVSSEYLLTVMEAIRLGDLVQTGAVPSLNMGLIRSAKVMWSSEANSTAGPTLGHIRALTRELREELSTLRSMRTTLLSGLLNHEIDVPGSYDDLLGETIP
jgi:type I restriction enzyme S subunit